MADSNRISGRQGASTSGRQVGASVSGRVAAPSASGRVAAPSASGRAPAQAPAVAPRAASSARMAPQPAAVAPTRPSGRKANVSGRGRGGVGGEDQSKKKKGAGKGVGGKELLIAFAIIAVLAAVVIVKSMSNNAKIKGIKDAENAKLEAQTKNYESASKLARAAEDRAALMLIGKEEFDENKHFGSFKADPSVFNVIYERTYKDKKGEEKHFHKALYPDRLSFVKTGFGTEENGVRINYALADNKATNVVMAVKNIKLPEGDNLNVSAMITVISKAPMEDPRFDLARNAKDPSKEKDAPKTDAPKAEAK